MLFQIEESISCE